MGVVTVLVSQCPGCQQCLDAENSSCVVLKTISYYELLDKVFSAAGTVHTHTCLHGDGGPVGRKSRPIIINPGADL